MDSISQNLSAIKETLPSDVTLVAVSKTYPVSDIELAYNAGQIDFGENKVQEMVSKQEALPNNVRWHLIGHLQKNKVKYIVPFVYLIHSVDSLELLETINKYAANAGRVVNCLIQVHVAQEDSKFGLKPTELHTIINLEVIQRLQNIKIMGIMGMATNTTDPTVLKVEFAEMKSIFEKFKLIYHPRIEMEILSMGMSGDYNLAIEQGSNCVRIGSAIFGKRNYA